MGRERRRRNRARTGRTGAALPGSAPVTSSEGGPPVRPAPPARPVQVRSDRVIERESRTMLDEMRRVAGVSAVCFGMLAVLVVVDRLQ